MVSSVDILTLTPGHLNILIVDNRPSPTSKRWSKVVTKKPSKYHGSTNFIFVEVFARVEKNITSVQISVVGKTIVATRYFGILIE